MEFSVIYADMLKHIDMRETSLAVIDDERIVFFRFIILHIENLHTNCRGVELRPEHFQAL